MRSSNIDLHNPNSCPSHMRSAGQRIDVKNIENTVYLSYRRASVLCFVLDPLYPGYNEEQRYEEATSFFSGSIAFRVPLRTS